MIQEFIVVDGKEVPVDLGQTRRRTYCDMCKIEIGPDDTRTVLSLEIREYPPRGRAYDQHVQLEVCPACVVIPTVTFGRIAEHIELHGGEPTSSV